MKRINFYALVIVTLTILVAGGAASAQGDLTIETLAEALVVLNNRIDRHEERLDSLEEQSQPQQINEDQTDIEDACQLALRNRVHLFSLGAYLEQWPDHALPTKYEIVSVWSVPENGTAITFEAFWNRDGGSNMWGDRFVTESWLGCEFLGAVWYEESESRR